MKLLIGTQNQGKLVEVKQILAMPELELVSLVDFPDLAKMDVEETGETFADNALLKAKAYVEASQVSTIADDSGLEIEALGGLPGVKSARFAPGSDEDRIEKVLELMKDVPDERRKARFVSTICFIDINQPNEPQFFEGQVLGHITQQPKGTAGFGYDPIFMPQGYGQTFGQLGQDVKNSLSHRQRALEKFKLYLQHKM